METVNLTYTQALGAIFQVTYRISPSDLYAIMREAKNVYESRHPDVEVILPDSREGKPDDRFHETMSQFANKTKGEEYCNAIDFHTSADGKTEIRRGHKFAVWGDALTGERWGDGLEMTEIIVGIMKGRTLA